MGRKFFDDAFAHACLPCHKKSTPFGRNWQEHNFMVYKRVAFKLNFSHADYFEQEIHHPGRPALFGVTVFGPDGVFS
jgi:hypothetical protein